MQIIDTQTYFAKYFGRVSPGQHFFLFYSSNKIRKAQNKHLNIICQNLKSVYHEFNANFLNFWGFIHCLADYYALGQMSQDQISWKGFVWTTFFCFYCVGYDVCSSLCNTFFNSTDTKIFFGSCARFSLDIVLKWIDYWNWNCDHFLCRFLYILGKKWLIEKYWSALVTVRATKLGTLARTDLLCKLNWGTQWTMVSYLKK